MWVSDHIPRLLAPVPIASGGLRLSMASGASVDL